MAIKDWTTDYPTQQDNLPANQPDLDDRVDKTRSSQVEALRDKLDAVARKVGDDSDLPAGCLLERVSDLETSAVSTFLDLTDTPAAYTGQAGKGVRVKGTEDGLEFTTFVGSDEKVKATATDTTPSYLDSKLAVANGLTKTILLPSGNEQVQISPTYGSSANTFCQGNDARLSDARTPTAHASTHKAGGVTDEIKLDELAAPTDVTTLNASVSAHGLLPKLGGGTTNFLRADGTWAAPPGGGGGFSGREQEFTATGGDQNFTLSATPATNANMLSGVNIIGVFRNGQRLRYQASPTTGLEFGYTAPTTIVCKSLTAGDIITAVYSV